MVHPGPSARYPDPQTMYDPDPEIVQNVISQNAAVIAGTTLGLAVHAIHNWYRKRPLHATAFLYIPYAVGIAGAFEFASRTLKKYYARRDTIHKHYVQLHPEDFPPPPKVKIGELFEDWRPVR